MKNLNFYSLDASNNQILRMIVNEIGNVGIGTSVASKKLEVTGDISFNGDLYQNGELFTGGSTIDETTDVSLNNLVIHGDLSANDASFNVIDVNTILIDGRDLISGAPEALDTLNELAAALDNSANFATNVTTTLSSIQSQLSTKQDSISTNDLSLGDINGLYLQLDSKQDTITTNDLTIAFTSGLQTALDSKHPLINETTDVSLNNLVIHGDLSANDASFNVIDVNTILIDGRDLISGAPEALDTLNELAAALDNSANFATNVTTTLSSIQSQLSTKQDSISTNDLSLGDINGLYLQLNSKQNTITNDDLTIAFTSGLQTALDSKHPLINETTDVSLNNLVIHGDLSANDASFNVIDASSINTTSTSYMNSIIPSANNLYSLGDASNVWKDVYIGPGSLYIDGQKVLESDADTIVVGADENQNLKVNTHGSGVLQMESASGIQITTTGSGNIVLGSTGSGIIRITDNLALNGNIEIFNDSTNEIKINDNLNVTGDYLQNGTNINTIYATLASPSLTGTPIAPTATSGTNTTQIATTAFVSTAVSNLVNGAPGALDTLSELASALDNSGNFATNVTNTLGSLQTQIDAKQPTISSSARLNANLIHDGTISNTEYGYLNGVTSAIQTQLDTKQDTITFNAPSSNNSNPSTSAQIKTALDAKQDTITFGAIASGSSNSVTSGTIYTALDAKQDTITFNAPSSNNSNPSTSAQIKTALDAKQDTITFGAIASGSSNSVTSGTIYTALDAKQDTITFNAPSSNNSNPSTSAQIKTALDAKQDTLTAGTNITINGTTISASGGSSQWTTSSSDIYYNTGNVGIGTTGPDAKLHIQDGSLHIYSNYGTTSATQNGHAQNSNIYLDCNSTGKASNGIIWKTKYNVNSDVYTKTSAGIYYQPAPSGGFFKGGLGFFTNGTADYITDATEKMRIDISGNVGIGTTNPTERLHVIGNAVFQQPSSSTDYTSNSTHGINLIPYGGDSGGNAGGRIFFDETVNGNQNYGFSLGYNGGADSAILNWESNTFNISRHDANDNGLKVISIDRSTSNFNSNGVQIFSDHPTSTTDNNLGTILSFKSPFTSSIKEEGGFKFVMDDTFLGTTIYPRLSIKSFQGTGSLWEVNAITFKTTSSNVNVGMGTTDPEAPLHIKFTEPGDPTNNIKDMIKIETEYSTDFSGSYREGGSSILFYVENTNDQGGQGLPGEAARIVAGCYETSSSSEAHSYLAFHTSNNSDSTGTNERMVIDDNGYVGIGTTNPQASLDIRTADSLESKIILCGTSQGTGNLYIGQSTSHGGGMIYKGDGTPSHSGSTMDHISFYRNNGGTNYEVFKYAYNSDNVEFNGRVGIRADDPDDFLTVRHPYTTSSRWRGIGLEDNSGNIRHRIALAGASGLADCYSLWYSQYGTVTSQIHADGQSYIVHGLKVGASGSSSYDFEVVGTAKVTSGSWSASDDRVKHNETAVENAIETIKKLEVKKYFKSEKIYDRNHHYELDGSGNPITDDKYVEECGIIAQQIKTIPELAFCVNGEEEIEETVKNYGDGSEETVIKQTPLGVNYTNLFCYNIKAVQELVNKVESHENEIESLKMFNTESNNTLNNLIQENQQIKQENQELKQQIQYIMQHLGL